MHRLRADELSHVLAKLPTPFLGNVMARVSKFALQTLLEETSPWRVAAIRFDDIALPLFQRIAAIVEAHVIFLQARR